MKFTKQQQLIYWHGYKGRYKSNNFNGEFLHYIDKFIGNKIIETGSGNGDFIKRFQKLNPNKKIIGTDIQPKNKSIIKADSCKLPFANNLFDTYISIDLLEHLDNKKLKQTLKEASRVTKHNSYIIILTKYNENLSEMNIICPNCHIKHHTFGHLQSFTQQNFKKFLPKQLKIHKIKTLNFNIINMFPYLSRIFYYLRLDKIWSKPEFKSDLLMILKNRK